MDDAEWVEVRSQDELRAWLAAHHGRPDGVWLVTWKKGRGPYLAWGDAVDELICYGWIDSLRRRVDEDRSRMWICPRRAGSNWSPVNKAKVAALDAAGRIAPPGQAAITAAREDGSWSRLDGLERLEVPADLAAELAALPPARALFDNFPPSARRAILEWLMTAKRSETRAKRARATAELAQQNLKANHPKGQREGPPPPDGVTPAPR